MMSNRVHNFLLSIMSDEKTLIRFHKNVDSFIRKGKLSPHERKAIQSADLQELRKLIWKSNDGPDLTPTIAPNSIYDVFISGPTLNTAPTVVSQLKQAFLFDAIPGSVRRSSHRKSKGLVIVGTGIRGGLQTTAEAKVSLKTAKKVLYLVGDPVTEAWIRQLNRNSESLMGFYNEERPRSATYRMMVTRILEALEKTGDVCVAFYGHPGVFVNPGREAIKMARKKGFPARMLPGVSSEDNLFADLEVDPGVVGLQSYEATSFLINNYKVNNTAGLVLWQIGVLGESGWRRHHSANPKHLSLLVNRLRQYYKPKHRVVLYDAADIPLAMPTIRIKHLKDLGKTQIRGGSTLYVPPSNAPTCNRKMIVKLGLRG